MSQSNTRVGDIRVKAGGDLTGKNGFLAKMTDVFGPAVDLVKFAGERPLYVVIEGVAPSQLASVRPLEPNRNVRLVLVGTCNPGDTLVAMVGAGANNGKVQALPAEAGTYLGVAVAEEAGVDGQLVLARPAAIGNVVIAVA
ncbi:MAG: hypothetical protein WCI03_04080 [bacterium]